MYFWHANGNFESTCLSWQSVTCVVAIVCLMIHELTRLVCYIISKHNMLFPFRIHETWNKREDIDSGVSRAGCRAATGLGCPWHAGCATGTAHVGYRCWPSSDARCASVPSRHLLLCVWLQVLLPQGNWQYCCKKVWAKLFWGVQFKQSI